MADESDELILAVSSERSDMACPSLFLTILEGVIDSSIGFSVSSESSTTVGDVLSSWEERRESPRSSSRLLTGKGAEVSVCWGFEGPRGSKTRLASPGRVSEKKSWE